MCIILLTVEGCKGADDNALDGLEATFRSHIKLVPMQSRSKCTAICRSTFHAVCMTVQYKLQHP